MLVYQKYGNESDSLTIFSSVGICEDWIRGVRVERASQVTRACDGFHMCDASTT